MNREVNILEVGPRDGFQNLKQMLTTEQKLEIIDGLINAGIKELEVTSFVSPKAIPQMADSKKIAKYCIEKYPEAKIYALIPNLKGAENAWNSGIRHVSYVISLSESHNKANINRTHDESFAELKKLIDAYPDLDICVGLATVFGCPFEGIPKISVAVDFAKKLWDYGIRSINLADTIELPIPTKLEKQFMQ